MSRSEEKPRVLMVDDDVDFQAIVGGWLAPRFEHVALIGGEDLLEELEGLKPDLLIMDVRMPGRDGFELCRRIRSDGRFMDLPILFLTGLGGDEPFLKNIEMGGTAYLTKPVERKRLLSLVHELTQV